jgi:hypothetical protein
LSFHHQSQKYVFNQKQAVHVSFWLLNSSFRPCAYVFGSCSQMQAPMWLKFLLWLDICLMNNSSFHDQSLKCIELLEISRAHTFLACAHTCMLQCGRIIFFVVRYTFNEYFVFPRPISKVHPSMSKWLGFKYSHFDLKSALSHSVEGPSPLKTNILYHDTFSQVD